ncbi:unnamed protein product [Thelazia callipaeda]|uniref:Tudor domain-containing protein n=1 Tax=Thelazia callipaeda TaxID=103827 RepID=A0A0N5D2J6_THECL|nr:unnamed protein product [Thelazia callipaeda]
MKLYRDDCSSALNRVDGFTCVFAKILSVIPLEVEDKTSKLYLGRVNENVSVEDVFPGDYCYLLLDATVRPIRCIRLTIVPEYIQKFAEYQLRRARALKTHNSNFYCL